LNTVADDPLSLTFAALADPTRRAILSRLAGGEATVNELAEPFAVSLQAISKHLMVLERAGLIVKSKDAQYRTCHLDPESLDPAIDWLDEHRKVWEGRLDRLHEHLRTIHRTSRSSGAPTTKEQRP
jgi:DNA-binding transcriptional ArsR family regulator